MNTYTEALGTLHGALDDLAKGRRTVEKSTRACLLSRRDLSGIQPEGATHVSTEGMGVYLVKYKDGQGILTTAIIAIDRIAPAHISTERTFKSLSSSFGDAVFCVSSEGLIYVTDGSGYRVILEVQQLISYL